MTRPLLIAVALLIGQLGTAAESKQADNPAQPIEFAHAHNDYRHERPLYEALSHGFCGVEADFFLEEGELRIGHDPPDLRPGVTLTSLYLEPLAKRIANNEGQIHAVPSRFILLLDVKRGTEACYDKLDSVLAAHADMLTTVRDGQVEPGPIMVIISGKSPQARLARAKLRHAGYDGRLTDLDSETPSHLMPMISDHWPSHFTWRGEGPMPTDELAKLRDIVQRAHAKGRIVRFWATPESETLWKVLQEEGVDLINTDQLARLAKFAHEQ